MDYFDLVYIFMSLLEVILNFHYAMSMLR